MTSAVAQESQLPPPSPPVGQYPLLENVDSYIPTPFTINQTQNSPIEFVIHNGNNFTLFDVQIHEFSTAHIVLTLNQLESIDMLLPNETKTIHGTIGTDPKFNATTGKALASWTVLGKSNADTTMESIMFHRDFTVVVPEISDLFILVVAVATVATIIGVTRTSQTRILAGRYRK
jgi:hypothetical protein